MSWVTIVWSMTASACLTLAAVNLLVWCKKRTEWANLLFSSTAAAAAGMAFCELWMMRAETPAQFGTALRWLHVAACASRLPNCLLLDLHMPNISGFEVLERLAAEHLPVPVVVITGHDQPGNAERVRALGALDYLLKPLNESQLLTAIRKVIQIDT